MDLIDQLRGHVDSATVIALPAVAALQIELQEKDLGLRGSHVTVTGDAALGSLFALLEEADLAEAHASIPVTVLRLKISLTNDNGTVAKLLFDGLPSPLGVIHGTVNGQSVTANAGFARQLRMWVSRQKQLAHMHDTA